MAGKGQVIYVKAVRGILKGIIGLCLLIFLILSIPKWAGLDGYAVTSGSMEPVLPVGAMIWIREKHEIKQGDIITFQVGESVITHRVAEVLPENQGYITKGDANENRDAKITERSQVLGCVRFSMPCLGFAAMILESTGGKMFAVTFVLWLLCLEAVAAEIQKISRGKGVYSR